MRHEHECDGKPSNVQVYEGAPGEWHLEHGRYHGSGADEVPGRIKFCPYCGHELALHA